MQAPRPELQRVVLLKAALEPAVPGERTLPPGRIEVTRDGVFVGTGTAAVRLDQVQPPGKKMMNALDWARGARLSDDTAFR